MQLPLMGGAYQARSIIASAQRCLNLYPEINQRETFLAFPQPAGVPTLLTHYPTPGLTLMGTASDTGWRGLYRANNGILYGVCGQTVYQIASDGSMTTLGTISSLDTMVSMSDNGTTLVLVDGSTKGYTITLSTGTFAPLVDSTGAFVGADKVDYLDTFFLFNSPGTQAFYSSLSNSVTFDPLYIANKTGRADTLVTLCVFNRQIWLLGERSSEIWTDVGQTGFPFAITDGAFIEHGCTAKYSVAAQDVNIFWLSKDAQGKGIVVSGTNYSAKRISTHAIEQAILSYSTISDAIGHIHQIAGHVFYVLTFPTADATWCYDVATGEWHERAWMDTNGIEHRVRPIVGTQAYGSFFCGDWETGDLYIYDLDNFTDNGYPIKRVRSFPHVTSELKRLQFNAFIADMQAGGATSNQSPTFYGSNEISLRYSRDRGATWSDPRPQTMGALGETDKNMQWRKFGIARDMVFELSWTSPVLTALNGSFIDVDRCAS